MHLFCGFVQMQCISDGLAFGLDFCAIGGAEPDEELLCVVELFEGGVGVVVGSGGSGGDQLRVEVEARRGEDGVACLGEKVADEKLTVALKPYDERIVMGERATANGFRTEEVTLIDKGVLKVHPLSLYAANKTGRPVMKNTGFDAVIEPGDKTFDEMIASVDKGLLLGGFSGGHPGANGEFSGVAKNSFLIENGKIKCAVTETMINGNLADVLKNITAVSKEQVCNGRSVVPYIAASGVVISGK